MRTTQTPAELVVDVREDATGDIVATFHGRAVPYGDPTQLGGLQETFAPGAFTAEDVVGKPVAYRHGEPIGVITGADNQADGLYIDGQILNTAIGRDAAILARNGASRGLSVGFEPNTSTWSKSGDKVTHNRARLFEVSLTHMPAYANAGVGEIREEKEGEQMQDTTDTTETVVSDVEAREAIAAVREHVAQIEARAFTAPAVHPLAQFRSFGEYSKAVYSGEVEARDLYDQVPANNEGVMPPMWMQQVKGIVDLGRPAITGCGGPESAGTVGLDINWPYFDGNLLDIVEEQTDPKDQVNSVAVNIDKGSATLQTWAAGSDIAYQLLQRSSPSYLDAHNRIMAASYAAVTDYNFTAQAWAGSNNTNVYDLSADTTGNAFRTAVFMASMEVQDATGTPATVVLASSDLIEKIAGWSSFYPEPYGVQNVSGVATAATLRISVSGIPVIRAKWLDTDADRHAIVTNSAALRWVEDGPRLATVENVAQLGRDVAIYGYATTAVYTPAGVVRLAEN